MAGLANLQLTEDEVRKFRHDLDEVLTHVEALNELDTSNVEPMSQVLFEADETATLREDSEGPTLGTAVALENAAVSGLGYFKIPRVIER